MNFYYCERTSLDGFDEPLNAISNIAFVICGLILIFRNKMKFNPLPYAAIFIGVSSFLFHYIPTKFFTALDIISIILFVIIYNTILTINILNYSIKFSIFSNMLLLIFSYLIGTLLFQTIVGSSSFYLGLLIYMVYILFLLKKTVNIKYFLLAIILFSISIIFRSIDFYLCNYISFGTHFIWHIMNSLVIYFLIIYIKLTNGTPPKKPTQT